MGQGFNGYIGIGQESTFGSGATITDYVEALSESLSAEFDRYDLKNIIGTLAPPDDEAGVLRVGGDVSFPVNPANVGRFLQGFFFSNQVTTVLSGFLFTNRFTSTSSTHNATSILPSYEVEVFRDVTSAQRYTGCVMNTFQLNVQPNNALAMTVGMIGRDTALKAKSTPTFPGSPAKPFTFDTASLSLGGSATTLIETLNIEGNNNLHGIPALNLSKRIAKVRRAGHQEINISGVIDFEDTTEYLKFLNQTEQSMKLSVTKADSFQMVVDLPRVVYTAFPMGISGRDRLLVNFAGKAFYHSGSGTAIEVALTTTNTY